VLHRPLLLLPVLAKLADWQLSAAGAEWMDGMRSTEIAAVSLIKERK